MKIEDLIYRAKSVYYRIFTSPSRYAKFLGATIGKSCAIATKGFPREAYLITIGDHVQVTEGVKFFTHGGGWVIRQECPDFDSFGKITIGNNVVIGSASVVTKSIPDNVIVAGIPAKVVKSFDEYKKSSLPYNLHCKNMSYIKKKDYLLSLDESKFIKK